MEKPKLVSEYQFIKLLVVERKIISLNVKLSERLCCIIPIYHYSHEKKSGNMIWINFFDLLNILIIELII